MDNAKPNTFFSQNVIWIISTLIGIVGILLALQYSDISQKEFGPFMLPFVIAPLLVFGVANLLLIANYFLNIRSAILSFAIISLPLIPQLNQSFQPNVKDDSGCYFASAKHIVEHKSLWGADRLNFHWVKHNAFSIQPAYRYWNALYLSIFDQPIRAIQFINSSLFVLLCLIASNRFFIFYQNRRKIAISVSLLILIAFPVGLKNCLQNLTEWMTVVILLGATLSFMKKRFLLFAGLLSLSVFFRQNLLFANAFILLIWAYSYRNILAKTKIIQAIALYVALLLLPLYHNLYYDNSFRLLVDLWNPYPYLVEGNSFTLSNINFTYILHNALRNIGYVFSIPYTNEQLILALFIPFYIAYVFYRSLNYSTKWNIVFLIFIALLFLPITLFSTFAYYPRFQYVTYTEVLLLMIIYDHHLKKDARKAEGLINPKSSFLPNSPHQH